MTYGEDGKYDAAYTYGLERLEVEALDETRPESQDPLYYLYDGLGSVAYMVKPDGNFRDKYRYDAYGKPYPGDSKLSEDGRINLHNTYGYTGEMWDEETELLYLRARYYEPETGRYISRDSYPGELENPLSKHLYAYVQNNPVNAVDPTGHNPLIPLYVYATAVVTSPDTQWDLQFIATDLAEGDYLAAGLDTIGVLIPGGSGFGKVSKPVRKFLDNLFSGSTKIGKLIKKNKYGVLFEGNSKLGWKHILKNHVDGKVPGKTLFPKHLGEGTIKNLTMESLVKGKLIQITPDGFKVFVYRPNKYGITEMKTVVDSSGVIWTSYPTKGKSVSRAK